MNKRQQDKLNKILAGLASVTNSKTEELEEAVKPLYSTESHMYNGQAIINFYKARIQPLVEKKETSAQFDKRFREWRIRICAECDEEFAYAFAYEGVKYCSLECLDKALNKIGLSVTRGRDLKVRYGSYHQAIVPPDALKSFRNSYFEEFPDAFDSSCSDHPRSHLRVNHLSDTAQ